jgi:integrase
MAGTRRGWGSVRKFPSGRWQARYLDPETHRMVPAPQTFSSKTAADRWLAKKRTELDAGTAVDDRTGKRPLRDWWPDYWQNIQSNKARTLANYRASWTKRIEPHFGDMPVMRIKPRLIDVWIAAMVADGVSAAKAGETVGVLKRVLDLAVRDRAIPTNPCLQRSVKLPKRPQMNRPVLSPAEVEKLAAAMPYRSDRVLVRLLAYGGLRIGEALALRWPNVDLARKVLTVRESVEDTMGTIIVGPTKTYAVRTITLPDALVEQLGSLWTIMYKTGLVFPNRNGSYRRYRNWRRDVWDKASDRSGVTALPHDLRATAASLLIDAGASPKDVQAHLGHEDITTTMNIYARVRPGRSADIASRLDALIAEAG